MKYTFALFFCLGALNVSAQETYTEKLQQTVESAGKIVLHQEKAVTDLVNGVMKKSISSTSSSSRKLQPDSIAPKDSVERVVTDTLLRRGIKVKMNGYRIQVYFGDNSRKGQSEARAAGLRFRNYFPGHSVYVSFNSPHWLCRVGDFRTNEEAREMLKQIRELGIFREAVVVKSKINARL